MSFIFESPIVARVHNNREPVGRTTAALFFNPASVIYFSVSDIVIPSVRVISVGVHQAMDPFQYSDTAVRGFRHLRFDQNHPNAVPPNHLEYHILAYYSPFESHPFQMSLHLGFIFSCSFIKFRKRILITFCEFYNSVRQTM